MVWLPAEYREVSEMKKHLIFWAAALLFQLASTASDVQNAVQPYLLPLPREYTQSEKFVSGTAHIYFEDNWGISAGTADFLKREFQWALNAVFTQKRNNGDFRLVLKKCPASELPSNPEAYTLAISAACRSGMIQSSKSMEYIAMPLPIWDSLLMQEMLYAFCCACRRTGSSIAARIAIMEITMRSSIRVKTFVFTLRSKNLEQRTGK